MAKNIFLASRWSEPSIIPLIEQFHNGYENKRIVFIPTASNGEYGNDWRLASKYKLLQSVGANIHVIELDRREYDLKAEIKQDDVVYISGGSVGYLMYWVNRQDCMNDLKELINSGVYFIASSAGAMILGETIQAGEFVHNEEEKNLKGIKGIGLFDFDILPHYQPTQYEDVKSKYLGNKLYLLQNNEAIIYRNDEVELVGNPTILTKD